ncbi:hypothetical protein ACFR97_06565 [Haloplanus litoreus]|uniref:DUF7847 domain-containing protein n=1 Tax=Haloplanus litoreus TaxID=767515 RepID=A0ABD5ZZ06_9EURY
MSAIRALRTAVDALTGGPVLVFGGLLYALVVLPQQALQLAGVPLVPSLLQMLTFFLTPFVVAGVVGVARTALDGAASFDSFTAVGAKRYVDLLLATFVEFGIKLAFGIGFVVLGFLLLAVAGSSGPAALVGLFVVAAVAVAYVLVLFGIQFYPVVVVLDDAGPVDAVTESVAFVRSNVVSTLGFSAITVLLGTLAALPFVGPAVYRFATTDPTSTGGGPGPIGGGMSAGGAGTGAANGTAGAPQLADALSAGMGSGLGLSTPAVVGLSLASLVATALFFSFRLTYATAFYRLNGRSIEERVLDDEW